MTRRVRRVVTGHDKTGKAVFLTDGPTPHNTVLESAGAEFFEIWNTNTAPATLSAEEPEPTARPLTIAPQPSGTVIRMVDIHPGDHVQVAAKAGLSPAEVFGKIGSADVSTWETSSRHPLMHRTETIDYGIVMEGEIHLLLDEDETRLEAGNVVIQRGTNHAWENRSDRVCRMAFILVDARYASDLRQALASH